MAHGFPTMLLQKLQIDRWIQSNDLLHRCLKSNNQCQCPASSPRIAEFCCLQLLLKKTWAKRPKKGYHQAPARRRHFASRPSWEMDVHGEPTPPSRMSGFEIPNLSAVKPQITVSSQPPQKKIKTKFGNLRIKPNAGQESLILDTKANPQRAVIWDFPQ